MVKETAKKFEEEQKFIVKLIFEGFSNEQIAKRMCYSRSTVAYRINMLFEKYQAKSRRELILSVMAKLVEAKNELIEKQKATIKELSSQKEIMQLFLINLISNYSNKNSLHRLINEAKSILKKSQY